MSSRVKHAPRWFRHLVFLSLVSVVHSPALGAQASGVASGAQPSSPRTQTATRDDWQRAADIFSAVGARPGSRIADVGAGEGWLTTRLAKHVGPDGRVFSVDISEGALRRLLQNASSQGLKNVEAILGQNDDPRLPFESLDGIVIVNAYHEMTERVSMLTAFKQALKPGGLIVIVDNVPSDSTVPRQRQMSNHQLWLPLAEDDLQGIGFAIVKRDPDFILQDRVGEHHRQWLLVARKAP